MDTKRRRNTFRKKKAFYLDGDIRLIDHKLCFWNFDEIGRTKAIIYLLKKKNK